MKLKTVIENVDRVKPNAFDSEEKTRWLNEIEGRIQAEILLFGPDNITVYTYADNADTELFVKPPYDCLYEYYLIAMIDFHNGEYDKYQNSMEMFDSKYDAFRKWFIEVYHPADHLEGCGLC